MVEEPGATFHFHHAVDVRFRDLDPMGHAHHSLPIIYVEEARAAYWREIAGRMDLLGIDYVLGEIRVRYHARIHFPARLDIAVRTSRIGRSSFDMEFEVRGEDGTLLSSGATTQVVYDYAAGRSKPMPDDLRARIEAFERGEAIV
jgi:acyl-CoA thioester hydrolase